jgi:mercuric ion transport protein
MNPCPKTTVFSLKRQRLTFWMVAVLVLGLIAVPWFAPLFYSL